MHDSIEKSSSNVELKPGYLIHEKSDNHQYRSIREIKNETRKLHPILFKNE